MPIYIGGNELDNLAIGANELDKAYAGTDVIYEKNQYTYEFLETLWFNKSIGEYVRTDIGLENFNYTIKVHLASGTQTDSTYNNSVMLGTSSKENAETSSLFAVTLNSAAYSHTGISLYLGFRWYNGIPTSRYYMETAYLAQSASRESVLTMKRGTSSYVPINPSYMSSSVNVDMPITEICDPTMPLIINGILYNTGIRPFRYVNMDYYEITIYDENDVLKHDLKPARRSDNVTGFYDVITNKFYEKQSIT